MKVFWSTLIAVSLLMIPNVPSVTAIPATVTNCWNAEFQVVPGSGGSLWSGSTLCKAVAQANVVKKCPAASKLVMYKVDKAAPGKSIARDRTQVLRWAMRIPTDLTVKISLGSSIFRSWDVRVPIGGGTGFGFSNSRQYPFSLRTNEPVNPGKPVDDGTSSLTSLADVYSLQVFEERQVYPFQKLCLSTMKASLNTPIAVITGSSTTFLRSTGLLPIWKQEYDAYPIDTYWAWNRITSFSKTEMPRCTGPIDNKTTASISKGLTQKVEATKSKTFGVSASYAVFSFETVATNSKDVEIEFTNHSKKWSRQICAVPKSFGNLEQLPGTGVSSNGTTGIPPFGMIISVSNGE